MSKPVTKTCITFFKWWRYYIRKHLFWSCFTRCEQLGVYYGRKLWLTHTEITMFVANICIECWKWMLGWKISKWSFFFFFWSIIFKCLIIQASSQYRYWEKVFLAIDILMSISPLASRNVQLHYSDRILIMSVLNCYTNSFSLNPEILASLCDSSLSTNTTFPVSASSWFYNTVLVPGTATTSPLPLPLTRPSRDLA